MHAALGQFYGMEQATTCKDGCPPRHARFLVSKTWACMLQCCCRRWHPTFLLGVRCMGLQEHEIRLHVRYLVVAPWVDGGRDRSPIVGFQVSL